MSLFERFLFLDFQKPAIICSLGLVIHRAENLSTMKKVNFLFFSFYVLFSFLSISINECFVVCIPINSLVYSSFNLSDESRVLSENFFTSYPLEGVDVLIPGLGFARC